MSHFGFQTASGHLSVPEDSKAGYAADVEERFRADAAQIIARYPQKRSALLPMLHLVQSVDGYITGRGIALCAELLELTTAEVSGVATFYTQYKRHPNGRYTVGVCTNTLCAIMGGDAIWEAVSAHLGIGHDETTEDGMITLERVECNAACDFAPVVMTNWEFFDNQTPESTIALVDDLRAGKEVRPTRGPDKVVSFKETSRVLAGFLDGLADEGVGAGPASLAGLDVAKAHGWSAPAYPGSDATQDTPTASAKVATATGAKANGPKANAAKANGAKATPPASEPAASGAVAAPGGAAAAAKAAEQTPEVTPADDEATATKVEPAAEPEKTAQEGSQAEDPKATEPVLQEEKASESAELAAATASEEKARAVEDTATEGQASGRDADALAAPATLFAVSAETDVAEGGFGPNSAKPNAAGFGPSGWLVKGNANSMLFHTPESPWYGRTKAEVWFKDAESATAAGFTDARERRAKSDEKGADK